MHVTDSALVKLCDTFSRVECAGNLDECLYELSLRVCSVLEASGCAIALLSERQIEKIGLRPGTGFGDVPKLRYRMKGSPKQRESDPGKSSTPYADIQTESTTKALDPDSCARDKMFSAIVLHGKVVGVIHVHQPQQKCCFNTDDLQLFSVLTLFITKSIQLVQLKNIMNSRFAQMALTRSENMTVGEIITSAAQNPEHIARILAKSFYREMTRAGFSFNQIICAASEVISELTNSVRKHSGGRKRRLVNDVIGEESSGAPGSREQDDRHAGVAIAQQAAT
jgi:L-methionine (R)-S-oxide reductase